MKVPVSLVVTIVCLVAGGVAVAIVAPSHLKDLAFVYVAIGRVVKSLKSTT
jgi:hypothetical protein